MYIRKYICCMYLLLYLLTYSYVGVPTYVHMHKYVKYVPTPTLQVTTSIHPVQKKLQGYRLLQKEEFLMGG